MRVNNRCWCSYQRQTWRLIPQYKMKLQHSSQATRARAWHLCTTVTLPNPLTSPASTPATHLGAPRSDSPACLLRRFRGYWRRGWGKGRRRLMLNKKELMEVFLQICLSKSWNINRDPIFKLFQYRKEWIRRISK